MTIEELKIEAEKRYPLPKRDYMESPIFRALVVVQQHSFIEGAKFIIEEYEQQNKQIK